MIVSKKLSKLKEIKHGFFNNKGGRSTGIYKSLNCGPGSNDYKTKVFKNLRIVKKKIGKNPNILYKNRYFFENERISRKKENVVTTYLL